VGQVPVWGKKSVSGWKKVVRTEVDHIGGTEKKKKKGPGVKKRRGGKKPPGIE